MYFGLRLADDPLIVASLKVADALLKVPELGRELCRKAILKYVPAGAPRRYLNKLKPVREELRRELDRLLREEA